MPALHISSNQRARLAAVALGREPADTVVRNARVVNVFTGEVQPGQSIAIAQGRIARVDDDVSDTIGPATLVIDADDRTITPGFMDTHCHALATRYTLGELLRYAVPGGTTLLITETIELGSIFGLRGIEASLDAIAAQPIKILATVPPLAAVSPYLEQVRPDIAAYRDLLARPEVVGLGETYWGNIQRDEGSLRAIVEATLEAGKVAEGHSAGARGAKLQAYVCEGISSCHEPITAEEGLARLRLGLHFMIRDGEIRQDLEAIAPLWKQPVDHRRMIMVTDSVGAERLLERGYLEHNVQRAIDLGLDPIKAIQMVTLNPAEHFRIDSHVGAIAPGRCADLVLLPGLREMRPLWVMSDGRIVAREGQLVDAPRRHIFPEFLRNSVRISSAVTSADFEIPLGREGAQARCIDYVTALVTHEGAVEVRAQAGVAVPDEPGINLVASIDRALGTSERFVGYARGYGLQRGAVATTWSWDSSSLLVIGANGADMAQAVHRLSEVGGGAVVCAGGKVLAEVAAPIGGIISEQPMEVLTDELRRLKSTIRQLGCPFDDPLLALDVLSTAAIPHLRLTDRGYVRVRDGETLGLW